MDSDIKDSPKYSIQIVEEKGAVEPEQPLYNAHIDTAEIDERKIMRKIDIRLVPWFSLLYLLSFLDRTSIGNAKLYNLERDLKITDSQYLISLTVFFISYALFEVPSNIFLKRLRPSVWFTFLMVIWGLIMTLQGVAHNFGGLVGLRWMLGTFEAGLYPGMAYHLSCWYKRSELGIRTALFTSATTLSGAFGGLLAAAISNMEGVGGKPAWAWIFIIEGLATILVGIASYWMVQDFPDTAKFLTESERTFVIRRLQGDDQYSAAGEKLKMKNVIASFRDWKTWFSMVQLMEWMRHASIRILLVHPVHYKPAWFVDSFHPANLLTVPIYAFAAVVTCCVALYADKHGRRGYCNIVMLSLGAVGYIILIISRNAALSYFAVFVATCGIFPVVPNTVTWIANNFEGTYKRGASLALAISMGNLNGAVSSNVYRARDTPWTRPGLDVYLHRHRRQRVVSLFVEEGERQTRDRGERDEVIGTAEGLVDNGNGVFATVEDAKREKGDNWSGYSTNAEVEMLLRNNN
ncbi:MFS domain-containing protein [Mycena sanguinolenta]|uniref:MFS domain-containing protein n=1 Tax=Mycena sanguinolenta TaxID=230812 RepID=A0A8H6Z768_9AGAR|nr:MFS domain-containing protein [Mycena sanguinolenta]